jgi:hypothetical protein
VSAVCGRRRAEGQLGVRKKIRIVFAEDFITLTLVPMKHREFENFLKEKKF